MIHVDRSKYEGEAIIVGKVNWSRTELKRNESMNADLRFIKPFPALAKTGFSDFSHKTAPSLHGRCREKCHGFYSG